MKSSIDPSRVADVAREALCRHLSDLLRAGASHVRVRLHRQGASSDQAWFYSHQENHWKKQGAGIARAELDYLVRDVRDTLTRAAAAVRHVDVL